MNAFSMRAPSRGALRGWGLLLAILSVTLPALLRGPIFEQPPLPLAVLWAAYGWAAEDGGGWRAPVTLALLGLLHDQLAGGPYGPFIVVYLSAYLIGRGAAVAMSAPNLVSLWGGFIFMSLVTILIVWGIDKFLLPIAVRPYAETVGITALLFPLVRPLYMESGPTTRARPGFAR